MKQATKLYPVLWNLDTRTRTIATPQEMVRFGGKGRLDAEPHGFIVMTRSTSKREALNALFGRGADRQLAAR